MRSLGATYLVWSFLSLLLLGCGQPNPSDSPNETDTETPIATGTTTRNNPKIKIPVKLNRGATSVMSLTSAATAYNIELSNCISGYNTTITEAQLDGLEVYTYDRGCRVKLNSFTWEGRHYVPTAGDPFTTWQTGDAAEFDEVGEPGTYAVRVIVIQTLSDPVQNSDAIEFGFAHLSAGTSRSLLSMTASAGGSIQDGASLPPSFTIKRITLVDLDAGTEAGRFFFDLECTATIGITDICQSVNFVNLDIKLVEDTYGGTITETDGDTIFSTSGATIPLPANRIAPGDLGLVNGGIKSTTLTGPGPLATTSHLLLVIRSYGVSYQYFNVDVNLSSP